MTWRRFLVGWWFVISFGSPDGLMKLDGYSLIYATEAECWERRGAALTAFGQTLSSTLLYGVHGCEAVPEPQPVKPL